MINKTYETEILADGKLYFCAGTLELEVIDDGIGSYEYWGSKGVDHNWCYDLMGYTCSVINEKGDMVTDMVTRVKVLLEYESKATAYITSLDPDDEEEPVDDSENY